MKKHMLFVLIFITSSICYGSSNTKLPEMASRTTDLSGALSDSELMMFNKRLSNYEKATCHQIAILILPSVGSNSIESFSLNVAKAWKLGYKDIDNGLLLVLATADKKARIEVGLGLETVISDEFAHFVMNNSMVPAFKAGNNAAGLWAGINVLMQAASMFEVPDKMKPAVCRNA